MEKKGGLTKGASHARGGIKMTVKDTGSQIEVEGGEGIINKHVMSSDKKVSYKGKKATPCEIASDLNQTTGNGVSFDCAETKNTDMTPTDASTGFASGGVVDTIKLLSPSDINLDTFSSRLKLSGSKQFAKNYTGIKKQFIETNNNEPIIATNYFDNKYSVRIGGSFFLQVYVAEIKKGVVRAIFYLYRGRGQDDLKTLLDNNSWLFTYDFSSKKEAKELVGLYFQLMYASFFVYNKAESGAQGSTIHRFLETPIGQVVANNTNSLTVIEKTEVYKKLYPFSDTDAIFDMLKKSLKSAAESNKGAEATEKENKSKRLKETINGAEVTKEVLYLSIDLFTQSFIKGIRQSSTLSDYPDIDVIISEIGKRAKIDTLRINLLNAADKNYPINDIRYTYNKYIEGIEANGGYSNNYIGSAEDVYDIIEKQKELKKKLKTVTKEVAVTLAPILRATGKIVDFLKESIEGETTQTDYGYDIQLQINQIKELLPYFDDNDIALQKEYFAELERLNLLFQDEIRNISLRDKMLKYYRDITRDVPDYANQKPSKILVSYNFGGKGVEESDLTLQEYMQVRSPKFKSWFGNWQPAAINDNYSNVSKVINPVTKEPLVVYHGTGGLKVPFTEFTFDKFPVNYFGENYKYADWFKKNKPTVNLLYGVYLNIKNPLDFSEFSYNPLTYEDFILAFKVKYGIDIPYDDNMRKGSDLLFSKGSFQPPFWWYIRNGRTWLSALKKTRFDGLCFIENNPSDKTNGSEEITKAWCIFDANQVKLAGGLNKEFSLLKNDIRMSKGGNI